MKLDLDLLKKLYLINHPSKYEYPMISFIINYCYTIPNLEFEMDHYNNLFITKTTNKDVKTYACLISHMDCVLDRPNRDIDIQGNIIRGKDTVTGKQIALGMDDANGICVCLQLLRALPDLKVCFTTEEEIGFLGAQEAAKNVDFFYNVKYMIQPDRRGNSDLITWTNGIHSASPKFVEDIKDIMTKYGYKEAHGVGTDVGELSENLLISGINVSCGYSHEHQDTEETNIKDLENCLNFIRAIIKWLSEDETYDIKLEYQYYGYPRYNQYPRGKTRGWDWYDYYNEEEEWNRNRDIPSEPTKQIGPAEQLPCDTCKNYDCMNCKYTW